MTSLALCTCFILLEFVGMFFNVRADRSGTVVFMEAGGDVSLAEMFHNSVYNDCQNSTKYLWDLPALMTDPVFRSPLLDIDIDLNMTRFDLYAYNGAGEVMISFAFKFINNAVSSNDENLSITDTTSLASMILHADNATERVRFLSINVKSTDPYGVQFILTTDDDFHDLPEIEMIGCYMFKRSELFSSLPDTWITQSGDECAEYCITTNGSQYALAFTTFLDNQFSHRCTCVSGLESATNSSDPPLMCPDASECGCSLFFEANISVSASVYDMGQINSFLNNLTTQACTSITISTAVNVQDNYHDLGQRYFITKIQFEGYPDVPYKLGLQVAEGCGSNSNFTYYGQGLGSPQVFNGNTAQTLYPTPARCLKLEILKTYPDVYTVNVSILTDTFVTAKYLQVVGHWTEDECQPVEILSNTTAVPDTWINIKQMNESSTSTTYGNNIPFPEMSTGVVNITLPNETLQFYVLQRIKLIASADTTVHTHVEADGLCVTVGTGNTTHQKYDMQSVSNVTENSPHIIDTPNICAGSIIFVMNTINPTGNLSSRVNRVKFVLQGCVIYDFDLHSPCYTTNITDAVLGTASVSWYWIPHPVRAVTYLRPGEPGLVLHRFEDPYIVIQLSENSTPVELKRVSIRGDVISADIKIGNVNLSLFNDSTTILDFTPTQALCHEVRIDNIIGRSDIPTSDANYDFLLIHVEIDICVVATGDQANPTSSLTTASPTTNATASSHLLSNTSSALPSPTPNGNSSTVTPQPTSSNITTAFSTSNSTTAPFFYTFATQPPLPMTTALTTPASGNSLVSSSTTAPSLTVATSTTTTTSTAASTFPASSSSSTSSSQTSTATPTGTTAVTSVPATSVSTTSFPATATTPTTMSLTITTIPTTSTKTSITSSSTTTATPITTSSTTMTTPTTTFPATTVTPATTIHTSASQPTTTSFTSAAQPTTTHLTTTVAPTTVASTTSATQTTVYSTTTTVQTTSTTAAQPTTTTSSSATLTSLSPASKTTGTTSSTSSSTTSSVTSSPTTTQWTTSEQTVTTESSPGTTPASSPPPTPAACCICFSNTENMTQDEVEYLVQQLVRNLTVPRRSTSAFKRSLISAPDNRTSAKMVGTAGIAMMTLSGGLIVAMDYSHIVAAVQFCKHMIKGFFLP